MLLIINRGRNPPLFWVNRNPLLLLEAIVVIWENDIDLL
jgi:hypothetical protein